jgi:large subunit ribosomal protein L10
MPKTRAQKEHMLASLNDRLTRAQSVVFISVKGVRVDEVETIRNALFEQGLQLQVAKNSLLKRALTDTGSEVPQELLDQPVGLVFSYEDPIAASKVVMPLTKDIETLQVLGGLMDKVFIETAKVEVLSKLPSREQLLGQLVGTLQAPISGLVNVLHGNIRGLVQVLAQVRDAKPAA